MTQREGLSETEGGRILFERETGAGKGSRFFVFGENGVFDLRHIDRRRRVLQRGLTDPHPPPTPIANYERSQTLRLPCSFSSFHSAWSHTNDPRSFFPPHNPRLRVSCNVQQSIAPDRPKTEQLRERLRYPSTEKSRAARSKRWTSKTSSRPTTSEKGGCWGIAGRTPALGRRRSWWCTT